MLWSMSANFDCPIALQGGWALPLVGSGRASRRPLGATAVWGLHLQPASLVALASSRGSCSLPALLTWTSTTLTR